MRKKQSAKIKGDEQVRLFRRALAAYFADPKTTDWPDIDEGGFCQRGGLNYVVLYGQHTPEVLACYRVRHDGKLKQLSRLPEGIE